jgi:hypothetical protein
MYAASGIGGGCLDVCLVDLVLGFGDAVPLGSNNIHLNSSVRNTCHSHLNLTCRAEFALYCGATLLGFFGIVGSLP